MIIKVQNKNQQQVNKDLLKQRKNQLVMFLIKTTHILQKTTKILQYITHMKTALIVLVNLPMMKFKILNFEIFHNIIITLLKKSLQSKKK